MGGVVTVNDDGSLNTIWDIRVDDPVFQTVADFMANLVRSVGKVTDIFRHFEVKVGEEFTHEILPDGSSIKWKHFMVQLPSQKNAGKKDKVGSVIEKKDNIPTVLGRSGDGGQLVAHNKKTVNLDGLCYPSQYTFDMSTEELIVRHILNNDVEKSPIFRGSIECDSLVYSRFSSDRPHQDEWLLSLSKILKVKSGIHCTLVVRPSVREDFIKPFSQILKAFFNILDKSGLPANHIQFIFSGNPTTKLFPSSSQFSNKVWDFLQDCLDNGVTIHEIEELIEEFLDENIK